jgi:lysozyme family protein
MQYDTNFLSIIEEVIQHEGGYVDDPLDKGGETNYGISKRWYPNVDIKNLSKEDAVLIYYRDYWKPSKAYKLPQDLQKTYFDMCVNMGQSRATKILQQAINSKKSSKIDVDGRIGTQTISNADKVTKGRLQAYRCLYYGKIISKQPEQERFYYGWYKRAISV